MCTLLVATRHWPDAPLLIAANRDEQLGRPAAPPQVHRDRTVPVVAPIDLREGGTWLGVNQAGVFAGITNRFGRPPDGRRRSRGELVFAALEERSAGAGAARVAAVGPGDYNPFHLVVADRDDAELVWCDGEQVRHERLPPGVHVITERSLGAAAVVRDRWLRERALAMARDRAPEEPLLEDLLRFHGTPPLEGTCVHLPAYGYGTRSSTLLRIGDGPARLLHADGPPCQTPYRDLSALLDELAGTSKGG